MNSERVRKALKAAFAELKGLDSSLLRQQILEYVGTPIAQLLIGSGMFEGREEAAQLLDPYEGAIPTAVLLRNTVIKSPIGKPAFGFTVSSGRPYIWQVAASGMNPVFGSPGVHIAPLAASFWNTQGIYWASTSIQQVVASSVVVAHDDSFVRRLDRKIPTPLTDSEADEPYAWAA